MFVQVTSNNCPYILHTLHKNFTCWKQFKFSFCLEFCFCMKVHFTLEIVWSYCDSNAVFIVDVSRVHAISSSDGKKQNQGVHIHCISENFRSGARKKKDKNTLEIGYQNFKRSPNFNMFVVKYQSFTKFSIRWPVTRYIL